MSFFLAVLLFFAPGATQGADTLVRPKLVASIFPIFDIARRVVGDRWESVLAVPPGRSDHFQDPSPKTLRAWQGARLLVRVGAGLDDALASKISDVQDLQLFSGVDPHFWLDPVKMRESVSVILDRLLKFDPAGASEYRANAVRVEKELETLHRECEKKSRSWKTRSVVTQHASLGHFSSRYGLRILGVLEEFHGKEPSAKELGEIILRVRKEGRVGLIAEPQEDRRAIDTVAQATQLPVVVVDPLGGTSGKESYEAMIRAVFESLEPVLR